MTDDEVIQRARILCERGPLLSGHETIDRPRLRRIVDADEALPQNPADPVTFEAAGHLLRQSSQGTI